MNRPDLTAPGAGPGPEMLEPVRLWVAAFVVLLIIGPVILTTLLLLNEILPASRGRRALPTGCPYRAVPGPYRPCKCGTGF